MTGRDPVLCPECGWTGQPSDLEAGEGRGACPVCGETIAASQ
jgi:predicted RNA-binding Zn-ribbon protein involved in translation (DUF1610 family)